MQPRKLLKSQKRDHDVIVDALEQHLAFESERLCLPPSLQCTNYCLEDVSAPLIID